MNGRGVWTTVRSGKACFSPTAASVRLFIGLIIGAENWLQKVSTLSVLDSTHAPAVDLKL
jgi:hypothetical protein